LITKNLKKFACPKKLMTDLRKMRWETSDLKKKWKNPKKNSGNSGPTPVAHGG